MSVNAHDGAKGRDSGMAEDSSDALTGVFNGQYVSLVRLAAMLTDDVHAAEDIVQDAYLRVAGRHYRLRDPNKALAYLRQTVVNLARNSLRRRLVARRHETSSPPLAAGTEEAAIRNFEQQAVIEALRELPRRHREVVVMRYYLECSVQETAELLGLSTGSVKAYAARGTKQLKDIINKQVSK